MSNYAVIMAGGAGTRLWPLSRTGKPKQLLRFIETEGGPRSLLNVSAARLRGLIDANKIYICTGAAYTQQVLDDLATLPAGQILPEPMGRDTANAVGFSAAILHKRDPNASMAILTADHIITPTEVFQGALRRAFDFVEKQPEYLVTFGITPTGPATGFGYVRQGAEIAAGVYKVDAFREKPKLELAQQYVASGEYFWNSGMFVWKAATLLEQLKQHLPASYEGLMKIAAAWDNPQREKVLNEIYPTLQKIAIDFAVMEKAPHVATVAMPVKWLDVGSWPAYAETLRADSKGNRVSNCLTQFLDAENTTVISEDPAHLIAVIGTRDLLILHTPHATLVCPAKDAERIKQMVGEVEKVHGKKHI